MARCVLGSLEKSRIKKFPQSYVSNQGCYLGGAFNLFLLLTLILGEDSHFDELICFSWVGENHQLVIC